MNSANQMIKFALGKSDFQVQSITTVCPFRQENSCGSLYVSGPKCLCKMGAYRKLYYCCEVLLLSLLAVIFVALANTYECSNISGDPKEG